MTSFHGSKGTILHKKVYLSRNFVRNIKNWLDRSVCVLDWIKSSWINLKGSFKTFCTENCKSFLKEMRCGNLEGI